MKVKLLFIGIITGHLCLNGCSSDKTPSPPQVIPLESAAEVISTAINTPDTTTIHVEQKPVADSDLELLRGNAKITNLLLDESNVTDIGISTIATMPNLIHLRVQSEVTDACIDDLLQIKTLQFLNLPLANFTDEGLKRLATHPHIQLLRLRSPRVTDVSMASVAAMKHLAFLHFIEIPITDAGLEAFYNADDLQSLYLDKSQTTEEGLSALLMHQPSLHLHVDQLHLESDPNKDKHEH